ncbi:MAG: hypothetical protein Fur0011_6640 [Candidatus Microgenomates bacterium]
MLQLTLNMTVILEVFLTKIVDEKVFYKRVELDITQKSDNPDDLVILLVQKYNSALIEKNKIISHSTSWRHQEGSTIITYIVYSDEFDFEGSDVDSLPLSEINIIQSGDPVRPAPKNVSIESVISHGIRHLAFLTTNNPSVYGVVLSQNTILRFKEIDAALAGKI